MKYFVRIVKLLVCQTIVTGLLLGILYIAVWLNPAFKDAVFGAITQNFDLVSWANSLFSEVKALLLN